MISGWIRNPTPDRLFALLIDNGWAYLIHTDHWAAYYRWREHPVREELHINFDGAGRISGWTVWHNVRQQIDQDTGRRQRLEAFIETEP